MAAALATGLVVSAAHGATATVNGVNRSYSVTNGNATVRGGIRPKKTSLYRLL